MNLKLCFVVGGALGIAFAASGLSQVLVRDNRRYEIYPNGTTPIAAFLTNATQRIPNVNATSATFAETIGNLGNQQYNSSTHIEMFEFFLSSYNLSNNYIFCILYFPGSFKRQKRSLNDPVATLSDLKSLFEEANSISWSEFSQNYGSNFAYGAQILNSTTNHIKNSIG